MNNNTDSSALKSGISPECNEDLSKSGISLECNEDLSKSGISSSMVSFYDSYNSGTDSESDHKPSSVDSDSDSDSMISFYDSNDAGSDDGSEPIRSKQTSKSTSVESLMHRSNDLDLTTFKKSEHIKREARIVEIKN